MLFFLIFQIAIRLENTVWLFDRNRCSISNTFFNIFLCKSSYLFISWHLLDIHDLCQRYKMRIVFVIKCHWLQTSFIETKTDENVETVLFNCTTQFECERVKYAQNLLMLKVRQIIILGFISKMLNILKKLC